LKTQLQISALLGLSASALAAPAHAQMDGMDMGGMPMPAAPSASKPASPAPKKAPAAKPGKPAPKPAIPAAKPANPAPAPMNGDGMKMDGGSMKMGGSDAKTSNSSTKMDGSSMKMGGSSTKMNGSDMKMDDPSMQMGNGIMQMGDMKMPMKGMNMGGMNMMAMRATTDVASSMARESSGTSWQPDSSPMYMIMKMRGRDQLMFHGMIYPRYTRIGSRRDVSAAGVGGRSRVDAPSMFMFMYAHPLDKREVPRSQLGLLTMFSLDPILERSYGYPLLFQSGESFRGQPIHDRQHPHDLVDELAATYSRRTGGSGSAYIYLGYPGEPALGPPTFMHRASGIDFPDAPLGHHWEDSTHITFGVATLGYNFGRIKVESSAFSGREPNENRYNFDSPSLNSYSGRVSWNPTRDLALQTSYGFIKSPEQTRPNENQNRTTASILYNRASGRDSNLATALVFGQNNTTGEGLTHAYTFETAFQKQKNTVYLRAEHVQKSGSELALPASAGNNLYGINALSLGYVRDFSHGKGVDVGLGVQGTLSTAPSSLRSYYGSSPYTGFQIFFRIRPSKMNMESMDMSGH